MATNEERALRVHLEVCLDDEPVTGRLRPERGADEGFVGWLAFLDALKRLRAAQDSS
jgi:hypothetical protein